MKPAKEQVSTYVRMIHSAMDRELPKMRMIVWTRRTRLSKVRAAEQRKPVHLSCCTRRQPVELTEIEINAQLGATLSLARPPRPTLPSGTQVSVRAGIVCF